MVGINDYEHWPDLEYAVADAKAVADVLANDLGFPSTNIFELRKCDARANSRDSRRLSRFQKSRAKAGYSSFLQVTE